MIDIVIIVILAIALLAAYYRGTVYAALSLLLTVISFFLALALCSPLAGLVKKQGNIYASMLYYFEGHEYISKSSVEMVHASVDSVSDATLEILLDKADMPVPFASKVLKNVRARAYQKRDIYSLGDYFNETVVDVVMNLILLLLLFAVIRPVLGFFLKLIDYSREGMRVLREFDALVSSGIGLLHGIMLVFILFMIVPVVLTVLPVMGKYIDDSVLGGFFYRANLFLPLIPSC